VPRDKDKDACLQKSKNRPAMARVVDDLSCLAFTAASTVTIMFWALHIATGGLVERSGARPPWLGFSVHVANFIFAVADITLGSPRTFSRRSFQYVAAFAVCYATWLAVCRCWLRQLCCNMRQHLPRLNHTHSAHVPILTLHLSLLQVLVTFCCSTCHRRLHGAFFTTRVHVCLSGANKPSPLHLTGHLWFAGP
jgi:FAR-17a/AIG1-like protein